MAAVAKNPQFAKKVGISQKVGEEFLQADKGRKFNRGGEMKDDAYMKKERRHVAAMKKAGVPKNIVKEEMKEAGMEGGGVAKKLPTSKQMGSLGMKKGGNVKMADGGATMYRRTPALPTQASDTARAKMAARPTMAMKKGGSCKGYAEGGNVRTQVERNQNMPKATLPAQANVPTLPSQASDRAKAIMAARAPRMARGGGVESKGKTKGTMVKMARGGGVEVKGKTRGKMV